MHLRNPNSMAILTLVCLTSCSGGGGGAPPVVPMEPPPPEPPVVCHTAQDVENNDDCQNPQAFGALSIGCDYLIEGTVDASNDPFDGFQFQVPEAASIKISLKWPSPADLNLEGWTYDSCQAFVCACTGSNPETLGLTTTGPAEGFQLVVYAASGTTSYSLMLEVTAKTAAPESAGESMEIVPDNSLVLDPVAHYALNYAQLAGQDVEAEGRAPGLPAVLVEFGEDGSITWTRPARVVELPDPWSNPR